jgi:hypothetical protein
VALVDPTNEARPREPRPWFAPPWIVFSMPAVFGILGLCTVIVAGSAALGEKPGSGPPAGTATITKIDRHFVGFRVGDTPAGCNGPAGQIADLQVGGQAPYWNIDDKPQLAPCFADKPDYIAIGKVCAPIGAVMILGALVALVVIRRRSWIYANGEIEIATITHVTLDTSNVMQKDRYGGRSATGQIAYKLQFEGDDGLRGRGKIFERNLAENGWATPKPKQRCYAAYRKGARGRALFYGMTGDG